MKEILVRLFISNMHLEPATKINIQKELTDVAAAT